MRDGNGPRQNDTMADGGTESSGGPADSARDVEPIFDDTPIDETSVAEQESKREFLLEAVRRASLLQLLQEGPASVSYLSKSVDMSRSTVHRAINSLEESDIIVKAGEKYKLTNLGQIIADATRTFSTRASTAQNLSQFINAINMNGEGFPVECFNDVSVTQREARNPHATIHRIIELIESTDRLRMFSTVISPVYVDVAYREMMDGMKIEAIFEEEVLDLMLTEFPEKAHETVSTGNFEIYGHDDLPFELFLLDDGIGLAAHNRNGNAELLIECDNPAAIEWAENLYAKHLSKADLLSLA